MHAPTRPGARPGREVGCHDDAGSIPFAVLLTLVCLTLSAILVPIVVGQIKSSRVVKQRTHALHAAQTGLDVAVGHIRASYDDQGNLVLALLPCKRTGDVAEAGGTRFDVRITYYAADDTLLSCTEGIGVVVVPAYAKLSSDGVDLTTKRTLTATFALRATNENVVGGKVYGNDNFRPSDVCMDAGSAVPASNTALQMKPCVSGSARQTFAYMSNLNLVLTSSRTAANPLGMCIDAGSPHLSGNTVRLQRCAATTRASQQWSYNDGSRFEGTSDGINFDAFCFFTPGMNVSGVVTLEKYCSDAAHEDVTSFRPDAGVGAGGAGPGSGQLVNYQQFGRCMDVPGNNPTNAKYYLVPMIAWPCKQAPDPATVSGNQRWTLPSIAAGETSATGRIMVTLTDRVPTTTTYCLRTAALAGGYPSLSSCPAGGALPANMAWSVTGDTGVYLTSYRITDSNARCLGPTDQNATPTDFYGGGDKISKIIVSACSASTLQKWNAPPNVVGSDLTDIGES